MGDELLPYYNEELSYIRNLAAEFAEDHPKIAARLRISSDAIEDPHVARLIEAFAYLNARIRHKLDDDFPELSDAMLGVLYPHYLAPIPSMAIVQLTAAADLTAPYVVPAGAELETEPIEGEPCRFRSCYPVTLWPVQVEAASVSRFSLDTPSIAELSEVASVLKLEIACISEELALSELQPERLRFYLRGQGQHVYPLYQSLFNDLIRVAVAKPGSASAPTLLPPDVVLPVGFERDQGMLPYPPQAFIGYRLLTEFFAFPQKFLFFDVTGLADALTDAGNRVELYFYFRNSLAELEQKINAQTFALGCTPMVNLCDKKRAEPIQLDHTLSEYRVVPDVRRPRAFEVYSIDSVVATGPDGAKARYAPFFGTSHGIAADEQRHYWKASRRPAPSGNPGSEVFLSVVDLDLDTSAAPNWVMHVETSCLNRDLPAKLPFGGGEPRLRLTAGAAAIEKVECLTAPTHTLRPPLGRGGLWRLISHLTLNHLSITEAEQGAAALREMLRLYDFRDSAETRAMIEGIVRVDSRPVTARIPGQGGGALARGVEVSIEFDEKRFAGSGVFLFAGVLERFLALYCSINSFTRLVATLRGRDGVLRKWQPRDRRKDTALDQSLWQEPWRFEFFQAVRLLELLHPERKPVGRDFPAAQEAVRFRALLSRSFPAASVARIDPGPADGETTAVPEMQVAFMGLSGPVGVLPEGYLDLLLQRSREHDRALRDFLDLFNHRTISLFYRAWEKYRFPVGFERARRTAGHTDLFSASLECLVGIGTGQQKQRLPFADDALLRYAGHFAHFPRSAVVLETLLADYLQIPVKIEQLVGRWLPLEVEQRTQLPSPKCPGGRFNQLGFDLVIGTRVWDVQSTFRICLGPLAQRQFAQLLPGGAQLRRLCSLAGLYAGPELDFEVQLMLPAAEVPMCRLGGGAGSLSRLGWSTWLCSAAPASDRDDVRFHASAVSLQAS